MELKDFNKLSLKEKQKIVLEHGVFIENYIIEEIRVIRINLYKLYKFFVEIVYDAEYNVIIEVRSFKSGNSLDEYLKS